MKIKILLCLTIAAVVRGGIIQLSPGTHINKAEEAVNIEAKQVTLNIESGINIPESINNIKNRTMDFFDFCKRKEIVAVELLATNCNTSANDIKAIGLALIEEIARYEAVERIREKRSAGLASLVAKSLPTVFLVGSTAILTAGLVIQKKKLNEIRLNLDILAANVNANGNDANRSNINVEILRYKVDVEALFSLIQQNIKNFVSKKPLEELQEYVRKENKTVGEYAVAQLEDLGEKKIFLNKNDEIVVEHKATIRLKENYNIYNIIYVPHSDADKVQKFVIAANSNKSSFFSPGQSERVKRNMFKNVVFYKKDGCALSLISNDVERITQSCSLVGDQLKAGVFKLDEINILIVLKKEETFNSSCFPNSIKFRVAIFNTNSTCSVQNANLGLHLEKDTIYYSRDDIKKITNFTLFDAGATLLDLEYDKLQYVDSNGGIVKDYKGYILSFFGLVVIMVYFALQMRCNQKEIASPTATLQTIPSIQFIPPPPPPTQSISSPPNQSQPIKYVINNNINGIYPEQQQQQEHFMPTDLPMYSPSAPKYTN
jgi:hypothetical protein